MSTLPGLPTHLTVTLRLEPSPALLAAIVEVGQRLAQLFPPAAGSPALIAPSPAGVGAAASPDSSLNLPAAADTPSPVSSRGGHRKRAPYKVGNANWRTDGRAAVVRELWPTATETKEIVARVNAIEGPAVPRPASHEIAKWAFVLGVRRPPGKDPFRRADPPAASESVSVASGPASVAPAPVPVANRPDKVDDPAVPVDAAPPQPRLPSDATLGARARIVAKPLPRWTPERIALLKRDYRTTDPDDLLAKLQALPGAELNLVWMHGYASGALGLAAPPAAVRVAGERRRVSREAIEAWCQNRGWRFERFDIDAINRRCAGVGHPGFTVIEPQHRGAAA